MKHLLLDTNIIILLVRQPKSLQFLSKKYPQSQYTLTISIVTEGEIKSFAIQQNWGMGKLKTLDELLSQFLVLPIQAKSIIDVYAEIDAYSQGKLPNKPLNNSARNMGKNDLWIAATTKVINGTLITTDLDFSHLQDIFFPIDFLEIES